MTTTMTEEVWKPISEFPNYEISNFGLIYNKRRGTIMRASRTNYGHTKITLLSDWDGERYTRSVAQLVAEAFVEPPTPLCSQVVVLDGNLENVAAENLVWRPPGFAWRYSHQLRTPQPNHYKNLPVINLVTGAIYESIIEAGMSEGLLFDDIWKSTYNGMATFPDRGIFEVLK